MPQHPAQQGQRESLLRDSDLAGGGQREVPQRRALLRQDAPCGRVAGRRHVQQQGAELAHAGAGAIAAGGAQVQRFLDARDVEMPQGRRGQRSGRVDLQRGAVHRPGARRASSSPPWGCCHVVAEGGRAVAADEDAAGGA